MGAVKEAAKEVRKGEGFPMLVVCGFAFDPYIGEEAKQWPNPTILITTPARAFYGSRRIATSAPSGSMTPLHADAGFHPTRRAC